jgi:SAM-dependent methyltransferase
MTDSRDVNLAMWDERAPAHAASPDYGVQRFLADPAYLSHVVRFDLPRLADITGLDGVHLQCHIGTATISLARLGARMTGLDFSPAALAQARALSERTGAGVQFVEADVYDAVTALGGRQFDLVFTGIGALCWLPEITRWAEVVRDLLRPGGRLFLREGHPMLWSIDETRGDGLLVVEFPYFGRPEPLVWTDESTYVTTEASFVHNTSHNFSHGLGEIVTAVLDVGLRLTMLVEHDSVPWEAFPGHMVRGTDEEWRLADRPWRLAHTYTLQAVRPQ